MIRHSHLAILAVTLGASFALNAHNEHFHQEAPHVHGEAVLNIVREQQQITLELLSPGFNIVGFEHAPRTTEQQHAVDHARKTLQQPDKLFSFGNTSCQLQQQSAVTGLPEAHDHDHDHDHHQHGHKDIQVTYQFSCQNLPSATTITVKLFEQFNQLEKVHVQWISASQQGAATLTSARNRISL